jgi:hypothetical protein
MKAQNMKSLHQIRMNMTISQSFGNAIFFSQKTNISWHMYKEYETCQIIPVSARRLSSLYHSDILIYYYTNGLQIYHRF